ncbi:MAG: hypothetical protein JWN44_1042 [Myxococcales bacterium]|nr:hypothetical protein [Myxococcales bacterium]
MRFFIVALSIAAGCAPTGVTRQPAAARAARTATGQSYALDGVEFAGLRAGQLSASREWSRGEGDGPGRDESDELRATLTRDIYRAVRIDPTAPLRLRTTLTLQAPGYFEGLAAETADVTLDAELYDSHGARLRTITLRESASAPLQRTASRKARLEQAIDRLASRLATEL